MTRKWLISVCTLVVVIAALAYFGPQLLRYLEMRPYLIRPAVRGWDSPLQPLAVSTVSAALGTTLAYFGYKFEVPWKNITAVRNSGDSAATDFKDGQTVKFANLGYFPNPHWDEETHSNYEGYRSALAMTPAQLSPFSSHRKFAHSLYLLNFKGAWFEHNSGVPDIYSFQTPSYRGLEVSGLSRGWQWVRLYLFDTHDREFEMIISVEWSHGDAKLSQPEINRNIQTFSEQPVKSQ
jgi:hypothetical protein